MIEALTLLHNYDLDCLKSLRKTCCTCRCAICRPCKPAVRLCVYTIVYIILLFICACELNLNCFQSLCLALGSVHLAICGPW